METSIRSVLMTFACLAVLPTLGALNPPPDGAYPGGNTAEGQSALLSLTTGTYNAAVGFLSLASNTTNSFNTAVGAGTLLANTADENTATGAGALLSNTTGSLNTANGVFALFSNTTGNDNTAIGLNALFSNTTAPGNTAVGVAALFSNATGTNNTAIGVSALEANTTGDSNTVLGREAGRDITTGSNNTAVGLFALASNTTGSNNIALGKAAGGTIATGSNNIHIGHPGNAPDSDTIRIGQTQTRTFVGGIFGQTTAGAAIPVLIDEAAQLGTVSSSRRFKKEIRPMAKASEAILALKPVTFYYKSDKTDTPQFGLIAEDVAEINPDLVVRDKNGEIYTVRYEAVNAMLLNEFLKEHKTIEELNCRLAEQEAIVAQQKQEFHERIAEQENEIRAAVAMVEKQAAQIQKVSARVETRTLAPQNLADSR